ncbi:5-oxoprolinase subunit PxpB [Celeribacter litoreus]|uniref:5-oxoprolinase subunit PxpB n=1 Tax=Celeribacter litoreus TaxID=2876714 RepID=UPI001CCBEAC8|nr:5-oxoprolinase subunit PxpB [Celeribacter litoreus]MCA0044209.1 5-oxoprolinase subunit PxpB [Celeribacter litoreus]
MNACEQPTVDGTASSPLFLTLGDSALCVQFGEMIDPVANRRVIALAQNLLDRPIDGVLETVPTYRSLLVTYDPTQVRGALLEGLLSERITTLGAQEDVSRHWRVPVVYGGKVGMDLEALAAEKEMTPDALVELHSSAEYRVYMIGFAPGFAYLGGLPEALHTPRLPKPRHLIPAGAVGIGGQQGSINSVAGPSGWRYVGWTPWRTFDPASANPVLFAAGDRLRFVPVSAERGNEIAAAIGAGELSPQPEGAQ